ncbi:MAG: phage Gp37/Gp68 family protein [Zoogloeaceae bacterium]|jgi:protein gp37|nr:phage Gp37/Gp68 family protein [Zoogloeaceae bacterium]
MMGANSKIEWCDHTFNPWIGCQKVSPACNNCYAEAWAKRSGLVEFGAKKDRRRTSIKNWHLPEKWNRISSDSFTAWEEHSKKAEFTNCPTCPRVFCGSLCDVFDIAVPDEWRADLFRLIHDTPNLDWLLLTKRIANAKRMTETAVGRASFGKWMNLWLGATVCNQEEADRDIPKLLEFPATKRFLSIEPMLGAINISPWIKSLDWIIVGGETGSKARPMYPEWPRSIRDQCAVAKVPFFFKQWGEFRWDKWQSQIVRVGKKWAGCLLDSREHKEFP